MSSVDDRIVNMQWNSKQFTQGAAESQKALQSVDQAITNAGKSSGLPTLGSQVEGIAGKFTAMKVAGVTALATIVSRATNAGINMAKALTLDPIAEGFHNYETKINAVQTILSNTADQGTRLKDVTKNLNELQKYANLTVYNFAEMAKNIGTFTAAGVDLKTSTASIKGIANLAALSGSTSQQASSAMYQLSQAIAAGQVHLQDWNSVVNAGIGGAAFQKNLIHTALATGSLDKSQVHLGKTMADTTINGVAFRQSLTPPPGGTSWLTSKTLTTSLSTFTGDLSKAQLVAKGFPPAVAKAIAAQGKTASNAATQVKTFSQMFQALKEEVGTAYAAIFEGLLGNINQAKSYLSPLHTAIENGLTAPLYAVAGVIKGWRQAGGFTYTLEGLGNIFKTIGNLIHPFVVAFQTIAPTTGKAGSGLASLSHGFAIVTGWMEKASRGADAIIPILVAVFGVFGKVGSAISAVIRALEPFAPLVHQAVDAISDLADRASAAGANIIQGLIKGMNPAEIQRAVTEMAHNIVTWIENALGIHSPAKELIPVGENIVLGIIEGFGNAIKFVAKGMGEVIGAIFGSIHQLFAGFNAQDFAGLLNAAFTLVLLNTLRSLTKSLQGFVVTVEGVGKNIGEIFEQSGKTLKTFQQEIKARALQAIAVAVALLTVSLIALSLINPKKLAIGLAGITSLLSVLTGTLYALSKISSTGLNLPQLALSFVAIAGAIDGLALAVTLLGQQDPGKVAKGIGAFTAIMAVLIGTIGAFSKMQGEVGAASLSLIAIATAIDILVVAITALGLLSIGTLAKGLGAIAIGLGIMVGAMAILGKHNKETIVSAGAMIAMASAMVIMSVAVLAFGKMNVKTLAKGFVAMAVGLGLMVGTLLVLGANETGTITAAAAIGVMAIAMTEVAKVVITLGSIPWSVAAKGLIVMAAALALFLAAAAVSAIPVVSAGLLILGTSIALFGAGLFLAGTGVAAFAAGLAVLSTVGTASIAVIVAAIKALLALLPAIAEQVAFAFVAFLKVIANASTPIREAMGKIIENILGVITDAIPKIVNVAVVFISELLKGITKLIPLYGKLISTLIKTGLDVIKKAIPEYIDAGVTIIMKVLQGFADKLPKIVDAGGDLIINFIKGLGKQGVKIANAMGQTILDFLDGLDKAIIKYETDIVKEGLKIAHDIINGLVDGLKDQLGWNKIKAAVEAMANAIPGWAKKVLGISSPSKVFHAIGNFVGAGMGAGIQKSIPKVIQAAVQMANAIMAEGNKTLLAAERMASKQERAAAAARTRAKLAEKESREAEKHANQLANRKGATKEEKREASNAAIKAKKRADRLNKISDDAQKKSDRSAQHAQNVKDFQNADLHGKGDIKSDLAVALASRANQTIAKANAEAARGRELLATNRKAGRALLEEAKKDAARARELAKEAEKAHKAANKFYAEEVDDRIKQMEDDAAADEQAKKDQAEYDAADAQGKSDILTKRAEADDAKAAALKAQAEALIAQAKKLAKTDAAAAMKLLDKAQQASEDAQAAADQAADERDQAQQVLDQGSDSSGVGTGGGSIQLSQDILSQAASAVDRYTASLFEASALAAAQQGVIQFVQNNTSPEALSNAEIYRQSKNLLSAAELKMGENSNS